MVGVYGIENLRTNELYIGQSKNIERRWSTHRTTHKSNSKWSKDYYDYPLYVDMRNIGIENFRFFVIELCDESTLIETESFYISMLNPEYNRTTGENCNVTKSIITEKDVIEISDILKNTEFTLEEIGEMYGVTSHAIFSLNYGRSWRLKSVSYPLRLLKVKNETKCKDCNIVIANGKIRCKSCDLKNRASLSKIPEREELKDSLRKFGFVKTGDVFGVSDNAVRKWCIKYGLPSKAKEIKNYDDNEWNLI